MMGKTQRKKEARPADQSKRATVRKDGASVPQTYDMARDDPETWERGCRGAGIMLCVAWAVCVLVSCIR